MQIRGKLWNINVVKILEDIIPLASIDRKRNKLYIIYKHMSDCSYNFTKLNYTQQYSEYKSLQDSYLEYWGDSMKLQKNNDYVLNVLIYEY